MRAASWCLLIFFAFFYLLPLDLQPLWIPDEARYAEISREMVADGNWVVPHFLGLRYFEKPIAGYWINSLSQVLLGESNFSVRFGSALSTGLSAALVTWLAWRLWRSRRKALSAGIIYLSSLMVYAIGTYSLLDAMLTLWLNAAMVCAWLAVAADNGKKRALAWLLLGLACGMGFLTKGFIALAIPVIAVLPYMLYQRRWWELLRWGPLALLSALLLVAPWALLIHQREPDYWHYFFWVEHIQRFAADNAQHDSPIWYYLPLLLLGLIPWLGFLPAALRRSWRDRGQHPEYIYLASWLIMPLLFFSLANGKLATYILPCFAPLILLMTSTLIDNLKKGDFTALRLNAWLNGFIGLLGIVAVIVVSYWLSEPLYSREESSKVVIALAAFGIFAALGFGQLKNLARYWLASALCTLVLALGFALALPQSTIDSKQPQLFIQQHLPLLNDATYLLTNDSGVASTLAWTVKRQQIILLNTEGELRYGLGYPEGKGRYLACNDFAGWLAKARVEGDVVLVLRKKRKSEIGDLPPPDQQFTQHRLLLLRYRQAAS